MRVTTGAWAGTEALLRWERPGVGTVAPAAFIGILEETGLIIPVGNWILEAVCRQIAEWERAGLGVIRVAVNVSSRQLMSRSTTAAPGTRVSRACGSSLSTRSRSTSAS